MGARAECTWGEGPDVLVVVARENVSGFSWTSHEGNKKDAGSFGLTTDEALELSAQLVRAAVRATHLDAGYVEASKRSAERDSLISEIYGHLAALASLIPQRPDLKEEYDRWFGVLRQLQVAETEQLRRTLREHRLDPVKLAETIANAKRLIDEHSTHGPAVEVQAATPRETKKRIVEFLNGYGCSVLNDGKGNLIVVLPDELLRIEELLHIEEEKS